MKLATIFAIDVCAYAVMSNHCHVVLHINAARAHNWSDYDVCERWHKLYKGSPLTQKYLKHEPMPEGLPFHLKEYLELVDWTGRIVPSKL